MSSIFIHAAEDADLDPAYYNPAPFGSDTRWAKNSDNVAIGQWWKPVPGENKREKPMRDWFRTIPRSQAMAFAIYTHDNGVLKITGQCFPLLPTEPKAVTLELQQNGKWVEVDKQSVVYPGWSVHFRVENWDSTVDMPYRVVYDLRTGGSAGDDGDGEGGATTEQHAYTGIIRHPPEDKNEFVLAAFTGHHDLADHSTRNRHIQYQYDSRRSC